MAVAKKPREENASEPVTPDDAPLTCGLIMPISAMDWCEPSHWEDVKQILSDAIQDAGFLANVVSISDSAGILHKTIISNLYSNEMVVCDVSGRNPNVMFELGLRIAFQKPLVIVKDDVTPFSFDTGPIEHVVYRRDLRHPDVEKFQASLADKVEKTHSMWRANPDLTSFLASFGEFKVAELATREVSENELAFDEIKQELGAIRSMISMQAQPRQRIFSQQELIETSASDAKYKTIALIYMIGSRTEKALARLQKQIQILPGVRNLSIAKANDRIRFEIFLSADADERLLRAKIHNLLAPVSQPVIRRVIRSSDVDSSDREPTPQ